MKKRLSYIEGWLSIIINLLLFAAKYYAGIVSGSIAVIADAWHTLSDSLTSGVVIIGARISSKSSDKKHPFGHGRFELIASVIIGVLLAVAGTNFILESISKLRGRETFEFKNIIVVVFAASVVVKEIIARFSFWAAKESGSRSLRSDGWHHRSDALASALVLAGIFFGRKFWALDGILGIIVGCLIIYTGIKIIIDDADLLLGTSPSEDLIKQVRELIKRVAGQTLSSHHFHLHSYGDHNELTFHIQLPGETKILDGHNLADRIEKEIKETMSMEATIHMEPLK